MAARKKAITEERTDLTDLTALDDAILEAEKKAIDALSRYKFQMFGYWAAIWVHLNRVSGQRRPNPFKVFVTLAREQR